MPAANNDDVRDNKVGVILLLKRKGMIKNEEIKLGDRV